MFTIPDLPKILGCSPYRLLIRVSITRLDHSAVETDVTRIIHGLATKYTDHTCVFLHTDEISSELWAKYAKAAPTAFSRAGQSRAKFFGYIKTCLANHSRSLVQRHRFTQKRTGFKPPDQDAPDQEAQRKPTEISLDDPDAHCQVGSDTGLAEIEARDLLTEIVTKCNPLQTLVCRQLARPNATTLALASMDAHRGRPTQAAGSVRIDITRRHLAEGLGMSLETFEKTVLEVKAITRTMTTAIEDFAANAAVAELAKVFDLQIPKHLDQVIIRRLLTIAARDQWQKVDSRVEDLLQTAGAIPPKFNGSTLSCFGVLYQQNHRICNACGQRDSCAVQAKNVGLGDITLSPKLLGTKLTRTPTLLHSHPRNTPPVTASRRDMTIGEFLYANYRRVTHNGEIYFQPKEFTDKTHLIISLSSQLPMRLRFHAPSTDIKAKLVQRGTAYYAPDAASADDVIELINQHTKDAYGPA